MSQPKCTLRKKNVNTKKYLTKIDHFCLVIFHVLEHKVQSSVDFVFFKMNFLFFIFFRFFFFFFSSFSFFFFCNQDFHFFYILASFRPSNILPMAVFAFSMPSFSVSATPIRKMVASLYR